LLRGGQGLEQLDELAPIWLRRAAWPGRSSCASRSTCGSDGDS